MRASFDVVIAGGGTAGCVVAARLAEAGRRVLMLEAGPDYGPYDEGRWPAELADSTTIPVSHDWGYVSEDGRELPFERARVVGGCSAHNGCTISWGHRADYDGWAARGLDGWSAAELEPIFAAASARMCTRRFAPDEITPFHRGFLDAGVELGYPEADLLETLDGRPSVCAEPSNSPGGVRWNTAFAYLDPVRDRVEVRGGCLIDRVLIEGGRAVGVRAIGPDGAFEVFADLVVVSGGTYGSPAILLRSGIGPAEALRSLGIEVLADLPGVGGNLHDHPSFQVYFAPSEELERRTAAFSEHHAVPDEQGFALVQTSGADVFDVHLFPEVAMDRRLALFTAYLTPRSRGRVSLRSTDPEAPPLLDHRYLSEPADLAALLEGVEISRSFAASSAMSPLLAGELDPGPDADLEAAIRRDVVHCWHPVGTCAMGDVTDARGRVTGVDDLVVADASLMPATVRATTNLPTIVVAERIAARLVA